MIRQDDLGPLLPSRRETPTPSLSQASLPALPRRKSRSHRRTRNYEINDTEERNSRIYEARSNPGPLTRGTQDDAYKQATYAVASGLDPQVLVLRLSAGCGRAPQASSSEKRGQLAGSDRANHR